MTSTKESSVSFAEEHARLLQDNHELRACIQNLLLIRSMQVKHTFNPGYEIKVNKAWEAAEDVLGTKNPHENNN